MAGTSKPAWHRLARQSRLGRFQDPVQIATEGAQWGSIRCGQRRGDGNSVKHWPSAADTVGRGPAEVSSNGSLTGRNSERQSDPRSWPTRAVRRGAPSSKRGSQRHPGGTSRSPSSRLWKRASFARIPGLSRIIGHGTNTRRNSLVRQPICGATSSATARWMNTPASMRSCSAIRCSGCRAAEGSYRLFTSFEFQPSSNKLSAKFVRDFSKLKTSLGIGPRTPSTRRGTTSAQCCAIPRRQTCGNCGLTRPWATQAARTTLAVPAMRGMLRLRYPRAWPPTCTTST